VVATIFLPLTFITCFFGMNFGWLVDHIGSPVTFLLLGICLPVVAVVIVLRVVRGITAVEPAGRRARTPR
jgi:magnesium transporter